MQKTLWNNIKITNCPQRYTAMSSSGLKHKDFQIKTKMNVPHLIKAGDTKVLLGKDSTPPKVDCRVWAEDSYQEVLEILREVRTKDIETYVNGEAPLLPQKLRKRIHDFLSSNGR